MKWIYQISEARVIYFMTTDRQLVDIFDDICPTTNISGLRSVVEWLYYKCEAMKTDRKLVIYWAVKNLLGRSFSIATQKKQQKICML